LVDIVIDKSIVQKYGAEALISHRHALKQKMALSLSQHQRPAPREVMHLTMNVVLRAWKLKSRAAVVRLVCTAVLQHESLVRLTLAWCVC